MTDYNIAASTSTDLDCSSNVANELVNGSNNINYKVAEENGNNNYYNTKNEATRINEQKESSNNKIDLPSEKVVTIRQRALKDVRTRPQQPRVKLTDQEVCFIKPNY